jgi:hypothetical protein
VTPASESLAGSPDKPLFGFDVDRRLGERGQIEVCLLFLVERGLQQVGLPVIAERGGPCADRAITRHLVVLHMLGRGSQACVEDVCRGLLLDECREQ